MGAVTMKKYKPVSVTIRAHYTLHMEPEDMAQLDDGTPITAISNSFGSFIIDSFPSVEHVTIDCDRMSEHPRP